MKIEELMIGDLVVYLDGETPVYVVVRKINGDDGIVCLRQSDGHMFNTMIDFLVPILLTPNVLEKNGFKPMTGLWYLQTEERRPIQIVFKDNDVITISINCTPISINLKHFHQLQNTLRLFGIKKELTLP